MPKAKFCTTTVNKNSPDVIECQFIIQICWHDEWLSLINKQYEYINERANKIANDVKELSYENTTIYVI